MRKLATRAVHLPAPPVPEQRPTGLPVYRTATYELGSMQAYADVLNDRAPGYVYSRIDNPTSDAFASAVAMLEGAEAAQPFASGMAAVSTTLLSLLSAGDHVVAQTSLYGGTYSVLRSLLPRFGVETTFTSDAESALRPNTKLVYAETLANPTMAVADLPSLAALARGAGIPLVVDSTFATPVVCRPIEYGADLVIHSATKYIGGHGDSTGGVVVGRADLVAEIRLLRSELGGMLAPDEAFLLHRGLATLPLRVERHCASALAFARAMEGHPGVAAVAYPGLTSHPDHALAGKLFEPGMYGGVVMLTPHGSRDDGMAVCDRLEIAGVVTSLGATHTVVSHVPSTTHRQLTDEELELAGIGPAAIRVSIGLEDVDDLITDFDRAIG